MVQAMRYHRFYWRDTKVLPPGKVLEMVTVDAAKALGMEDEIGSLEVGSVADVCVWRWASTPLAQRRQEVARDLHDRLFAWITSGDERDLVETRVAGRRVHAAGYASG
jgi:guanine deaminase